MNDLVQNEPLLVEVDISCQEGVEVVKNLLMVFLQQSYGVHWETSSLPSLVERKSEGDGRAFYLDRSRKI